MQVDTRVVSCRQFEKHVLSVSVGDNILHSALCNCVNKLLSALVTRRVVRVNGYGDAKWFGFAQLL